MNKENKMVSCLLVSLVLIYGAFFSRDILQGASLSGNFDDGWNVSEVTDSSDTLKSGEGRVLKMWTSSGAVGSDNYAILVDTPLLSYQGITHLAFGNNVIKSPAVQFSTNTQPANLDPDGNITMISFEPYGVKFSTSISVWKSAGASGFANRVYIMWK